MIPAGRRRPVQILLMGGFGRPFSWIAPRRRRERWSERPLRWRDDLQAVMSRLARQFQHGAVTAEQPCRSGLKRKVDEFLVVRIAAAAALRTGGNGGRGGRRDHRMAIPDPIDRREVGRPIRADTAAKHGVPFVAQIAGGQPPYGAVLDRFAQELARRIAKDQPVEHDIGIEDQAGRFWSGHEVSNQLLLAGAGQPEYNRGLFGGFRCALCRAACQVVIASTASPGPWLTS